MRMKVHMHLAGRPLACVPEIAPMIAADSGVPPFFAISSLYLHLFAHYLFAIARFYRKEDFKHMQSACSVVIAVSTAI